MRVSLQFDEPWEFTEHLAGKSWPGSLDQVGWVELDEALEFRGRKHRRVRVQPRYVGDHLDQLAQRDRIIVNQTVETADGSLGLTGSIKLVSS